jgi:hypothetical protein
MVLCAVLMAGTASAVRADDDSKGAYGEKVITTSITKLKANPDAYKNIWVSFTVQFAGLSRVQNPFFTIFTPSDFANFSGWCDSQNIWNKDEFGDAFSYLFVKKDNPIAETIFYMKKFQRANCVGVVRNTFQGQPWIEVTSIKPIPGALNTETLAHLYRGSQFMNSHRWSLAVGELSLASVEGVPERVVGEVHRMLGTCWLRTGESEKAAAHLSTAAGILKEDKDLDRLARLAVTDPAAGLDRIVSEKSLKDSERPMWEAFEQPPETNVAAPPGAPPVK